MSDPIIFEDGETYLIKPKQVLVRLVCCDCGLVHDVTLNILDDEVLAFRLERNEQETEKIRSEFGSDS